MTQAFHYDRWILYSVLGLLTFGILMVTSASMVISDQQYGHPFHYLYRQMTDIGLGLVLAWLGTRFPLAMWERISGYLLIIGIVLLLVVLIPGPGRSINGSRRWLNFGLITLQVSELTKLFFMLYIARYLNRYQKPLHHTWIYSMKPMIVLFMVGLLLLCEPDFGTAAVLTITYLLLLFIAEGRLLPLLLLCLIAAGLLGLLAIASPYRLERLISFMHPWQSAYGSGYQLTQSLIAFGRGGILGVGLGNSVQKLFYLPEAHTDFLFAVVAEELGLLGELLLIALLSVFVVRIFILAQHARRLKKIFEAYLAYGIALWFAIQSLINIGVNVGLLPTKGLTLPFVSYGGSSMLVSCLAAGMILRLAFELQQMPFDKPPPRYQRL